VNATRSAIPHCQWQDKQTEKNLGDERTDIMMDMPSTLRIVDTLVARFTEGFIPYFQA